MSAPQRTNVFVSYASEDRRWKDKLLFKPLLRMTYRRTELWADDEVRAGEVWDHRIQAALASARVAVLLVSQHFLDSGYIREKELPYILEHARAGDVTIVWIPIAVTLQQAEGIGLARLQAVVRVGEESLPAQPAQCGREELSRFREILRRQIDPIGVPLLAKRARKYTIERKLGEGAMATVYLARDKVLGRAVAIKALAQPDALDDFVSSLREATKVADEPNFLRLYGAWLDGSLPYCVMQFVDGTTLRERIDLHGRGLEIDVTQRILLKIGGGLLRAHQLGYAHGNLKPSNIMLTKGDEPLISPLGRPEDCGGSRLVDRLKAAGRALNREEIAYLLPEEFQERTQRVPREVSDQYLLGLMAYDMLTGELPPTLQSLADVQARRAHAFVAPPPVCQRRRDCPEKLGKIIAKMSALVPEQRYPSLEQALVEVRRFESFGLEVAVESYRRCCRRSGEFFSGFYKRFLDRCKEAEPMFKRLGDTDNERWQRQHQLLREAVPLLFAFAALREWDGDGDQVTYHEPNVLSRIAREHTERQVSASWYQAFCEELIVTACGDPAIGIEPFDTECADKSRKMSIQAAWKSALAVGINYLRGPRGAPSTP